MSLKPTYLANLGFHRDPAMPNAPLKDNDVDIGVSSSLDAQETTQQEPSPGAPEIHHPLSIQSRSQRRLHAPFAKPRSRIVNALWHRGTGAHTSRASRIGQCGCCPTLRKSPGGAIGVDLARCRDRLCPVCGLNRGREVRLRVLACIEPWHSLRFITLTLRATSATLADRYTTINTAFTKLRRADVWKDNVTHAIAVPEITIGKLGQWHVHLHILCAGAFLPHAQLKKAWHEATGDSFIVHIEAVNDRKDAAKYVAGYIAGGNEVSRWSPDAIREYADAFHGKRMLRTYGKAKLPSDDDDDQDDVTGPSTHLCNVSHLLRAEHAGSEHIGHACDILSRLGFAHSTALDRDPPTKDQPTIDARELAYATDVAEMVEKAFPLVPCSADLEACRRRNFERNAAPPAPIFTQQALNAFGFLQHHR